MTRVPRPLAFLSSKLSPTWRLQKLKRLLLETGLFDAAFYSRNADVASSGLDPLSHYLKVGEAEGRSPHPLFDASYYLTDNPDVAAAGVNPLTHYFASGALEGRDPNPLFDTSYYLEQYPDVAAAGLNPLVHFAIRGAIEGRAPHPLFDTAYYLGHNPELVASNTEPLGDFLHTGAFAGRHPNPLFDTSYYLAKNPEVAATGVNPLVHYLEVGALGGRDPSPLFGSAYYLKKYPDVAAAGQNPLIHYLGIGAREGRKPHPLFDASYYLRFNPDAAKAGTNPLVHYLQTGAAAGADPNPLFDTAFYRERYAAGAPMGNALVEYVLTGARQEHDPGPLFDVSYYLARHPTLEDLGIEPLGYYLEVGVHEGHQPGPVRLKNAIRDLLAGGQLDKASALYELSEPAAPLTGPAKVTLGVRVRSLIDELQERGGLLFAKPPGTAAKLPPEYVGVLEKVSVVGGTRLILAEDNLLLHDELAQFEHADYRSKAPQVRLMSGKGALLTFQRSAEDPIAEGILLSSDHDHSYFHGLVECLPKLALLDTLKELAGLPLLIGKSLHPNLVKALEAITQGRRPLLRLTDGELYSVGRLIVPSDLSRIMERPDGVPQVETDCVLSPAWLRRASEVVGRVYQGSASAPWRKLYLTRRNASHRKVSNESELELRLLDEGFEVVNLDGASVASQVALFRQAALVVAPTGAAIANLMYCRPGTRFVVLTSAPPCSNFHLYSQLADILEVALQYVVGGRQFIPSRFAAHDDYAMDIDKVLAVVRSPGKEVVNGAA
ncbi:MAG: glycosyltransferase family 61 protein [Myxococcaceae bacterium]